MVLWLTVFWQSQNTIISKYDREIKVKDADDMAEFDCETSLVNMQPFAKNSASMYVRCLNSKNSKKNISAFWPCKWMSRTATIWLKLVAELRLSTCIIMCSKIPLLGSVFRSHIYIYIYISLYIYIYIYIYIMMSHTDTVAVSDGKAFDLRLHPGVWRNRKPI